MAEHDDYPDDEFDGLEPAAKKGAHRKPSGPLSQGAAIALVTVLAIVAIILVGGTINIIKRSATDPEKQDDTAQVDATEGADSTAGAHPTGTSSASATASAADVDRESFDVHVLNASGKTGAAKSLKTKLEDKGWNVTDTANASSSSKTTIVYYQKKSDKTAAQALAEDIGGDGANVKRSSQYSVDLAVVLCSDLA